MKKVVIVGAGPAGLTAAYELLTKKEKYKVTIIEECNQVGGICKTINYKGNRMDLGGHRFFSKNDYVNKLWNSILPKKDFLTRNRMSRIYYNDHFFDYPITLSFNTFKNLGLFTTIKCGFSYLKTRFVKLPEDNLENFYINRFGKELYKIFFKEYTTKLWGVTPDKLSSKWGAQRVKGLSITEVLKDSFAKLLKIGKKSQETSLIEKFKYPKYGPGQMYEELANKIIALGGKIILNAKVTKIVKDKNEIKSVVYTKNNKDKELDVDIFMSSMPIKDLLNITNNVPNKIKSISNELPYRDFVTVALLLPKLSLKNKTKIKTYNNQIPDNWVYVQDGNVKLGRIQVFNNWSPYLVKNKDTMWIGLEYFCKENDDFWNMTDKEIVEFAVSELKKMKVITNEEVIDFHREKIKKAYPAYYGSYENIDEVKKYLNTIDNLYCIGRNGQHRYNNMDHSMLTSYYAVECISKNIKDRDIIWNVNSEEVYHEEKDK